MSINDHLLETAGEDIDITIKRSILETKYISRQALDAVKIVLNLTIAERDELRRQVEDLRAEALAWHARAVGEEGMVTITLSLEDLRKIWASIRGGPNPYASEEN